MRRFWSLVLVLAAVGVFSACATHHHSRSSSGPSTVIVAKKPAHRHGPPPHAPAHGYRHKHRDHGVDLRYDAKIGAYLVIGHANHYYDDGAYFRWSEKGWQMSATMSGKWLSVSVERVPAGVRRCHD